GSAVSAVTGAPEIVLSVEPPSPDGPVAAGTTILSHGQATMAATATGQSITSVTINGTAVEAVDAAGHFFSRWTVRPGRNDLTLTVTDSAGRSAPATAALVGAQPPV